MCRVLKIAHAAYYAWLHEPESGRTIEDKRLLQLIRSSYKVSYGIYGYRRITLGFMAVWRLRPNEPDHIHSLAQYTAHGTMPLLNPFLAA